MPFVIDDWLIGFLFSKLADEGIKQFKSEKNFNRHLRGLIDQVERDFTENHPHKSSTGQYQFFASQKFINHLLEFRFNPDSVLDIGQIKEDLKNDSAILPFTDEVLNEYLELFEKTISNDPFLKELETNENYKEEIFKISGKLDRIEEKLDKALESRDQTVNQIRKINLPPPPDHFVGRKAMLEEVHKQLMSNDEIVLVNGIGGIGKTTIAQAYVHDDTLVQDFDQVAWIRVDTNIKKDFVSKLAPILKINLKDTDATEHFNIVRNYLANLPGSKLMVVDNANDLEDLNNNLNALKSIGWKIMITSRANPDDLIKINVDELDPADARELFLIHYKAETGEADMEHLDSLLELIYYHTLFIELLAKACAKKNIPLGDAAEKIENTGFSDPELQRKINAGQHAEMTNREKQAAIKDYMNSMFEPENASDEQQTLLRYFSVIPSEDIDTGLLNILFAVDKESEIDFENQLDDLFRTGWLTGDGSSYKMHGLVQEVVREKLKPDADNCDVLISTLGNLLQSLNITQSEIFLPHAEYLLNNIQEQNKHSVFLSWHLSDNYQKIGNIDQAAFWAHKAKEGYEQLGDSTNLAISYSKIGELYNTVGNFTKALEFYSRRFDLCKELLESDPDNKIYKKGLAHAYEKLGDFHKGKGSYNEALKFYNKQFKLVTDLVEEDPKNENNLLVLAIANEKLGDIIKSLGDTGKALILFTKELKLFQKLYQNNPNNSSFKHKIAIVYEKLGDTYQVLEDTDSAFDYFSKEVDLFTEIQQNDPKNEKLKSGLAIALRKLGAMYNTKGSFKAALNFVNKSTKLSMELHQNNPRNENITIGLAGSYAKLGHIYQTNDSSEQAIAYYYKGIELLEQAYQNNPRKDSIVNDLGMLYLELSKLEEIKNALKSAFDNGLKARKLFTVLFENYVESPEIMYYIAYAEYNLGEIVDNLKSNEKIYSPVLYWKKAIEILDIHSNATGKNKYEHFVEHIKSRIATRNK